MLLNHFQIPGLEGTLLAIQINLNAYMPAVDMRLPTLPIIGAIQAEMALVALFHIVHCYHVPVQFTPALADKVADSTTLLLMVVLDVCHEVKLMVGGE